MESFLLGPFTIKFIWLFLLAGLFLAYIIMDGWLMKDRTLNKNFLYQIILNSIMVVFITYKFSFLLFRPAILWENPIGILYFTGGSKGMVIGFILALLYLIRQFHLHQMNHWRYWRIIVYGFVTFTVSYYIVQTIFSLLI
ncbi:hypothetical protein ACFSO7_08365 [Bacillus sp. CGMCC 1.16607]|uniref:hypothetical protein n=1 Tax=Bacillus sp. CGMCC 1.16607 TaxID=3351842 RepID=UPI00363A2E83